MSSHVSELTKAVCQCIDTRVSACQSTGMLTKPQAIALFGSAKALQEALGLKSHAAISMWPKDRGIPKVHELKIRFLLKPESFDESGALMPTALSKDLPNT